MADSAYLTDAVVLIHLLEPKHLTSSFAAKHGLSSRGLKRCCLQLQSLAMIEEDKKGTSLTSIGISAAENCHPQHVSFKEEKYDGIYEPVVKQELLFYGEPEIAEDVKMPGRSGDGPTGSSYKLLSACSSIVGEDVSPAALVSSNLTCLEEDPSTISDKDTNHSMNHFCTYDVAKDKPFGCNHCTYTTYRKQNLKIHLRIHESVREKPFACSQCIYTIDNKSDLKIHLLVHESNRVKSFVCNYCTYTTDFKWNLKHHLRIHETVNDKPFACDHCTYTTDEKCNLRIHLLIHESV